MKSNYYSELARKSIRGEIISQADCRDILSSQKIKLLPLVNAAYEVREKFTGTTVKLHIINNVQNGQCSQDCQYCAQSKSSKVKINSYPMKSDDEILCEAKAAFESGAFRHCLVFAGRQQATDTIEHLAGLVRQMKAKFHPMEICVSPGFITDEQAQVLKNSGLDRLNHNINTSSSFYGKICSTHKYEDRLNTLNAAKKAGLQICSGVIVGMGETPQDVIDAALTLRALQPQSIPVNFYLPIEGLSIKGNENLTPEYCLRVLCLYRLLHPMAEIRVAAGREIYLRDMEVLCLYPANSIFINGYLNIKGSSRSKTLQMIKDAGFSVESDHELNDLLKNEIQNSKEAERLSLKGEKELRPQIHSSNIIKT